MNRLVTGLLVALTIALVQCSTMDFVNMSIEDLVRQSKCLEKYNLTIEDFGSHSGEIKRKVKCYMDCFFDYIEVMQNCTFIAEDLSTDEVLYNFQNFVKNCKGAVTSSDSCDCGYQLAMCIGVQDFTFEAGN